ncbi:MAG: hypothetical protein R8G66_06755 [Cytophagales bacterium]|nr:hypothetical protein [Cytophagales bacterium]
MYYSLVLALLTFFQGYNTVSFEMVRRVNTQGQTIRSTARVYFNESGDMVTKYAPPLELYIFNNTEGEIKLYNQKDNTVIQSVNYTAGTTNTNFYYFLQGETEDMGLRKLGFALSNTKYEDGLLITEWAAPMDMSASGFVSVELVHQNDLPVFLGHKDQKGNFVKKAYYYDYSPLEGYIMFPNAITEIEYVGKKDSVITKSNFENFRFDDGTDKNFFDFVIPEDATVLK